jgi:hypothetical protein
MNNKELQQDLEKLFKLKQLIANKVKKIYQQHNDLTVKIADEFCRRKGDTHADGILKTPLELKFKGNPATYRLVPNYMSGGCLKNVIWKHQGIHAFDIEKIEPKKDEDLPF